MGDLFKFGTFTTHAGDDLFGKIECDELSIGSIETVAYFFGKSFTFSDVYGIPEGGNKLAEALRPYRNQSGPLAIVDDVLTTSGSMEETRTKLGVENVIGFVIFSRGTCPSWVYPYHAMSPWAQEASFRLAHTKSRP